MLNIDRALGDDRLIKAIIGLSASEFNKLIERFMEEFQNEAQARYETGVELGNRERKPGGGRIGNLGSYATKLFFTLFYFKCYPTFDILGFLFDLDRSNAHRNAHKLASILEKALGKEMVLPARKISTVEELLEVFPDVKDLLIDGTERSIQRPKDDEKQKENYSGKKKMHTRKNIIISDKKKRIGYVGPTMNGKRHDYGMFKEEFPPPSVVFPGGMALWMDLGFTGFKKDYPDTLVIMPKKKPKGKELTDDEKAWNRIVSGFRVLVEHAIGGVKRFGIVSDKFRNRKDGFDDKVMVISCGLWNYHLKFC
ncbi:DDE superfamily endonuclease [Candidatus Methanomarinus sp.]|nr:DDE superfamily endonuclease [ANME-2 cluster archaeon]